tara:strand:- start:204 stop:659 length:456 start_codon:yes stop_codon:yes gene_type:complete
MKNNISIHKATFEDCSQLFSWFNEKDSLKYKIITSKKISFEEHTEWFKIKLDDSNTFIWIIKDKSGHKIGQIRFQLSKNSFYDVDIYIIKSLRGSGIASKAMHLAKIKSNVYPLRALVKKNNKKSYFYFVRNGFKIISEDKKSWELILDLT